MVECWPRGVDPRAPDAAQYPGWPVEIRQVDNYGRQPVGYLPRVEVVGLEDPVVQVVHEASGETLYTVRTRSRVLDLPVYATGVYVVSVGDPDTDRWQVAEGVTVRQGPSADPLLFWFR